MRVAIAILAVTLSASAAVAQSKVAASGVAQVIGTHSRFDRTGKGFPVSIQFTEQPSNGKITTKRVNLPIEEGECRSGDAACLSHVGRRIPKTQVIYTSKKGYRGADSVSYTRSSSDPNDSNNGRTFSISIQVN
jgi:hypothetical protein